MRLIFKLLAFPFVLVTGLLYLVCKFLGDCVRRGAGDFIRHCISGVAGAVLYCRNVGRACMAGDRVSDKPLRSANGGGLGWSG